MSLAKMSFDELNALVGYKISEPFEQYFAPMELTEEQKEKRIELAKRLDDVFIALLAEYFYADQLDTVVNSDIFEQTRLEYILALENSVMPDAYIESHAMSVITNTVAVLSRHKDEPYFYSADRARAIAEEESNSIWNYTEYEDAVKNKNFKTWHTVMDGKERESHAEVNGLTIGIDEPFELQGGAVMFPRDDSLGASDSELASCRCSLTFT